MLKQLVDIVVASVQLRVAQGDCPTEPAQSVETLENALLSLADRQAPAEADILRAIDSCGGVSAATDAIGRAWSEGYNDALTAAETEVKRLFARSKGGAA